MNTFKLEVGGRCANGADVLAVYMDAEDGIVLARWSQEFVTWSFATSQQDSTAHGNYFLYRDEQGEAEAYQNARADFFRRINKLNREA